MISDRVKQKCEKLLLEQKQNVLGQIKIQTNLEKEQVNQIVEELSNYDNHPGDQGSELFEREKNIALNEHSIQEIEDINLALKAIENGTYGICKTCGTEISEERLVALPTALYCINHAKTSDENRRPLEEQVLDPNIINRKSKADEDESTAFDAEDTWQSVDEYGSSNSPSDFYQEKESYSNMHVNSDKDYGTTEEMDNIAQTDISGKNKINRKNKK
ncbi:hypothetical protein GCM10011351_17010 [Paraliobacillus quinghaiensis]|uniref:Zinc finger DksA/TraR C4-type domain-containing protein n=1 Tax=Paraliobacillus quinghaiensis TaxID=470815 RepID=A0A917WUM0_9BACI|nr:TraR/DksA C4-type zinc finger protein [Paraliobacillus quinghaiensis]GGM31436.1 hypothetical protein GCM10011351_17010 [Paraliobacillus quinghaiensis]